MKTIYNYTISFLLSLTWLFFCSSAHGKDIKPSQDMVIAEAGSNETEQGSIDKSEVQWTMGVGLGVFDYHLYPGAKQTDKFILPVPYFTFRSPWFEVDRGIKSFIYNSEIIVIDLSADFGLPVDSDETLARKGMPDLDLVLQIGPSLEFLLNDRNKNYFDARFELPLRAAIAVDFDAIDNVGYLLEPRFSFNHRRWSRTGVSQRITLGLKFATEEFHGYYYDVAPVFATAARAEYKSEAGFGGGFANYRISYKTNNFVYWAIMRYQSLRGAEFSDSPLVLQDDFYFLGVGFAWIFANSL